MRHVRDLVAKSTSYERNFSKNSPGDTQRGWNSLEIVYLICIRVWLARMKNQLYCSYNCEFFLAAHAFMEIRKFSSSTRARTRVVELIDAKALVRKRELKGPACPWFFEACTNCICYLPTFRPFDFFFLFSVQWFGADCVRDMSWRSSSSSKGHSSSLANSFTLDSLIRFCSRYIHQIVLSVYSFAIFQTRGDSWKLRWCCWEKSWKIH